MLFLALKSFVYVYFTFGISELCRLLSLVSKVSLLIACRQQGQPSWAPRSGSHPIPQCGEDNGHEIRVLLGSDFGTAWLKSLFYCDSMELNPSSLILGQDDQNVPSLTYFNRLYSEKGQEEFITDKKFLKTKKKENIYPFLPCSFLINHKFKRWFSFFMDK